MRRSSAVFAALLSLTASACLDMSAPKSGVAAISSLVLPSPSVVLHDVMRDSSGAPAPLSVIAYGENGQPLSGVKADYFLLDKGARIDPNGLIFGDSLTTVRVVAAVAGIQTPVASVIVTASPDTVFRTGAVDTMHVAFGADTTKAKSPALAVKVQDVTGAPSQGFLVHYRVVYAPPSAAGQPPTVYLGDDRSLPTAVDTTDAQGTASRFAILRLYAIAGTPDSIVVEAAIQYKGAAVRGSPLRYVIPVRLP